MTRLKHDASRLLEVCLDQTSNHTTCEVKVDQLTWNPHECV